MINITVFDLDGVVNSVSDVRAHLIPHGSNRASDWTEWHKAHTKETMNKYAIKDINACARHGNHIVLLSNRAAVCEDSTMLQLELAGVRSGTEIYTHLRAPLDDSETGEYKARALTNLCAIPAMSGQKIYLTFYEDTKSTLAYIDTHAGFQSILATGNVDYCPTHVNTFRG